MPDLVNIFPAQCRLDFTSTTVLTLNRHNGAFIPVYVSGVLQAKQIPSSAPTLSNSGVANSTRYYIYAYVDGGDNLVLEYSTTAYVTDSLYGFKVKSGDTSRTLVGLAVTSSGGLWQAQGLGTLSWYNRKRVISKISISTHFSGNSASYVEVDTTLRVPFVNWADDLPHAVYNTSGGVNSGADQWLALYIDATTLLCEQYGGTAATVFMRTNLNAYVEALTDEVTHYVTLMRKESSTQFINGNQISSKMATVAQVCVMG